MNWFAKPYRRSIFLWLFAGAVSVSLLAQGPLTDTPAGTPSIRVQTHLVVLDVVVTDKSGRPVQGLHPSDFTVQEDGQPQAIRDLDYTAVTDAKVSSFRSVFVLDGLNSTTDESTYGQAQLARYLSTQPKTLAQPAMLVTVNDHGFQMLAPYTRDRHVLQDALHAYRAGIPFDFTQHDYEARLTITFDALRQIALANAGSRGRTELIWIGHGFPNILMSKMLPATAAALKTVIENITNLLLEARIVVYKVDPAPVGSVTNTPDISDIDSAFEEAPEPYADSISFDSVMQQTGGRSFFNRNDVETEVGSAVDLGGSFYTLSYSPSNASTAAAGYRHIRVLVDRPGMKAVTRLGYYGAVPATTTTPSKPEEIVDAAIINDLAYTALGIHVEGFSGAVDGVTHCTLRMDPEDIDWTIHPDGSRSMDLLVGIVIYSGSHKFLSYMRDDAALHAGPERADDDPASHALFDVRFRMPPDAAKLKVVVLAVHSGKLGSAAVTSIPAGAHASR